MTSASAGERPPLRDPGDLQAALGGHVDDGAVDSDELFTPRE
jgi:hypothetical protein